MSKYELIEYKATESSLAARVKTTYEDREYIIETRFVPKKFGDKVCFFAYDQVAYLIIDETLGLMFDVFHKEKPGHHPSWTPEYRHIEPTVYGVESRIPVVDTAKKVFFFQGSENSIPFEYKLSTDPGFDWPYDQAKMQPFRPNRERALSYWADETRIFNELYSCLLEEFILLAERCSKKQ